MDLICDHLILQLPLSVSLVLSFALRKTNEYIARITSFPPKGQSNNLSFQTDRQTGVSSIILAR